MCVGPHHDCGSGHGYDGRWCQLQPGSARQFERSFPTNLRSLVWAQQAPRTCLVRHILASVWHDSSIVSLLTFSQSAATPYVHTTITMNADLLTRSLTYTLSLTRSHTLRLTNIFAAGSSLRKSLVCIPPCSLPRWMVLPTSTSGWKCKGSPLFRFTTCTTPWYSSVAAETWTVSSRL